MSLEKLRGSIPLVMILADKRKALIAASCAPSPLRLDSRKSGQSYFLAPHVTLPW